MTMTLIETKTLGTSAASIEFTSIAASFTDLYILLNVRSTRSDLTFSTVQVSFNGLTTNRSRRSLYNASGSVSVDSGSDIIFVGNSNGATSNTFSNTSIYIPNYAGSTAKSVSIDSSTENNGTGIYQEITAALWNSTAAITSVLISASGYDFVAGSTASLYGILKGSDGIVTTS
jgi:hypothetical protein